MGPAFGPASISAAEKRGCKLRPGDPALVDRVEERSRGRGDLADAARADACIRVAVPHEFSNRVREVAHRFPLSAKNLFTSWICPAW